jgi:hypothetical protein
VVLIQNWVTWNTGMAGADENKVVDERAATLSRLDVPAGIRCRGLKVKEFIRGATSDWRVYWTTDGRFDQRRLGCSEGLAFAGMWPKEFPPGWLQPERMAVWEQSEDQTKDQEFLHVSLDNEATWDRIPLADGEPHVSVVRELG